MNPKTVLSVKTRNNLHWIHFQSKVLKVICHPTVLKKESIKNEMLGSITMYSAIWWDDLVATLSENERKKKLWCLTNPKKISSWASIIIQFIRFENHLDRPRGLKYFLEYAIHLSICSFMSHGCFTNRIRLKSGYPYN